MSRHVMSLDDGHVVHHSEDGSVTRLTVDEFPILRRLSIKRLMLAPGAIREPHWHANATELAYCIAGTLIVSVLDNESRLARFAVAAGQMFHIASGALHMIENVGDAQADVVIAFRHERPEDFSLHAGFGAMSDAVLGNCFGLPAAAFAGVVRDTTGPYIVRRAGAAGIVRDTAGDGSHRFDVEAMAPPVAAPFGSARTARQQVWPALTDISMYSLRIREDGMREPHWHPRTAEMGYIHKGRARMTILDPDGSTDTYDLQPGDVYFVPRAYPHHIEVLGEEEIHFLIFFDQPIPGDIGFRASASAMTDGVMAATFGLDEAAFPALPATPHDPLIVARVNPGADGRATAPER